MAVIAAGYLDMIQIDIKAAFLYGRLEEEIYMIQSEGSHSNKDLSSIAPLLIKCGFAYQPSIFEMLLRIVMSFKQDFLNTDSNQFTILCLTEPKSRSWQPNLPMLELQLLPYRWWPRLFAHCLPAIEASSLHGIASHLNREQWRYLLLVFWKRRLWKSVGILVNPMH